MEILLKNATPQTTFNSLISSLTENILEFESSIEELIEWKDEVILKMPSEIKLDMLLLFSKLFRTKSNLHNPLFELIRLVKIYSPEWNINREKMLELEKDFHRNYFVLDVAIRKLESMQKRVGRIN
jgi:hypothetical protein